MPTAEISPLPDWKDMPKGEIYIRPNLIIFPLGTNVGGFRRIYCMCNDDTLPSIILHFPGAVASGMFLGGAILSTTGTFYRHYFWIAVKDAAAWDEVTAFCDLYLLGPVWQQAIDEAFAANDF